MTQITLDICTPEGKTWLAEITGIYGEGGLDRRFINAIARRTSRSGKTGTATYAVCDGFYESNEGRRRLGRRYLWIDKGAIHEITLDQLVEGVVRGVMDCVADGVLP